jgi:hypothetical protein
VGLQDFAAIAAHLGQPLVLVGFVLFLFFGLMKVFLKPESVDASTGVGAKILKLFLTYGFVLGVLVVLLGFGLMYLPNLAPKT